MKSSHLFRLSKEAWIFLALTILSALILFKYVNLVPHVDNNFFFSNSDPQFQDEILISHLFVRKDTLLIINATGPIESATYLQKVNDLGQVLVKLSGITGVKSIARGPENLQDALQSPLWQRLLITRDHKSTNIIVLLQDSFSYAVIPKMEQLVSRASSPDFRLIMSGPPYIVELISRHLLKDIRLFTLLALMIFGVVIFLIFRSQRILLGAIISCMSASMWTLMIVHILGIKIGLLTANLATIVFVLTLSHIVFLTYNWKYFCSETESSAYVEEAIHLTFPPSFWCMSTALLGFLSLLLVPAQPLKELGASGIAGSLVALSVAYGIYPAFLRSVDPLSSKNNGLDRYQKKMEHFLEKKKKLIILGILGVFFVALPGLWKANTDPSLLSYFAKNSEIEKGLASIDHNGGSSPLILVIKMASGEKLDTDEAYDRLWKLQKYLEQDPAIGTIISLPVLMTEAKRSPLTFFLSWEWLLDILKEPQFDKIATSFITADHKEGLFLLRMNESNRTIPRLEVINEIKKVVRAHGFTPELVGGIYNLQGHLSKLVASSVIFGLGQLIIIFSLIAWVVSRSLRIALAITLSICVIPIIVLGTIGWLYIPLDVVSAPACNIALGLGIDSMIHMVRFYRRQTSRNKDKDMLWQTARHRFWQPILTFTLVMVLGFGIFTLSDFPSTQRFGTAVVLGTLIAALTALFVMPSLSQIKFTTTKKN
ncbi:MAG: MMPL family transporter [Candidatus Omnitrophica bacterium]|nr:MMPL family transporter [Candidatus Omnitrophota bacterium]